MQVAEFTRPLGARTAEVKPDFAKFPVNFPFSREWRSETGPICTASPANFLMFFHGLNGRADPSNLFISEPIPRFISKSCSRVVR